MGEDFDEMYDEWKTTVMETEWTSMAKEGHRYDKKSELLAKIMSESLAKPGAAFSNDILEAVTTWKRQCCGLLENPASRCPEEPTFNVASVLVSPQGEGWYDRLTDLLLCPLHARNLYLDGSMQAWAGPTTVVNIKLEEEPA